MLVAVPLYSWITSKGSRGFFVPLANRFFIACLVAFWICLALLPEIARPWIDRVFYVWTSVFALFVVTVFWGLLADCFDNAQAKRMFGFIAVGSSIGGMAGSFLTAWLGVGLTLSLIPVVVALGFLALGLYPTLVVLVVVQLIYRGGRYGLSKPAREILWTVLGREAKYKSKPFLDAAVYRGGDLVSGWIYTGLAAIGLSIGTIAFVAAPVAAIWAMVGLNLGRRETNLAIELGEKT
jgi:AAA family ATP:ADP antiporter